MPSFAEAQDAFLARFFSRYPIHATDAATTSTTTHGLDLTDVGRDFSALAWLAERAHPSPGIREG